ncbi:MAG: glycosyltransferase family 4 protein [Prolixibacteraceae bacterium]|nr:glycosyltransferase family 4 protein [Prolixibacteraceae bacterium]
MKITHLISSCAAGGAEIFVKSLLIELKKLGVEVELWVMSNIKKKTNVNFQQMQFAESFSEELTRNGINIAFIDKRAHKDWLFSRKRLQELYLTSKPDIIHSHLESVSFHLASALFFYKVPLVQTIHSTKFEHPLVMKYFMSHAFIRFVAISEKVSFLLSKRLKVEQVKIIVINNGIKIKNFQQVNLFSSKFLNNHTVKRIIAIGRLTKAKDYPNLLNAFNMLLKKLNEVQVVPPKLLIVGEGELRPEIESLINSLDLKTHVSLLGLREDIPSLLRSSDIYVMASEWEGFSISLIEAMATGLPIIATDAGSNSEIVENDFNGYIVPTQNHHLLSDALFNLILDNEKRKFFSNNAIEKVQNFSIEISAQKHLQIYKEILKNAK